MKKLFWIASSLFAVLSIFAADFGSIPRSLVVPPGETAIRNLADDGWTTALVGAGGPSSFITLTDAPNSYAGAGQFPITNNAIDGLIWSGLASVKVNGEGTFSTIIYTPSAGPTTITEGAVYSDSGGHHLIYYDGTDYRQLDNAPTPTATATATPSATATATPTATPTATVTQGFTAHFNNGGNAITTNTTTVTPWTCPYSGTITGWSISVDSGTCTLKTWKKANGTAIPTVADVISTIGVSISTGTHIRSSTVSDFTTTTVTAGDMFMATVTATSGPTDITFQVEITR